MKSLLLHIVFYVFFSVLNNLEAQENKFYHYGLEDGLSQESVQCILKDSQGFLWLGTQDGLNRFDGNQFTIYKNDVDDINTISGNFINELLEDDQQNIWVATANNGVCFYDGFTNVFSTIKKSTANCTSIVKDNKNTIYASFLNGKILKIKKQQDSLYTTDIDFFTKQHLKINKLAVYQNSLFVATKEGRLFVSSIQNKGFLFKEIYLNNSINDIRTLYVDQDYIWIGTSLGLYNYNIKQKITTNCNLLKFDKSLVVRPSIEAIKKYQNTMYVATDNGLFILNDFDIQTAHFSKSNIFKGDTTNKNSITSNRVYDVLLDGETLWIGTNKLDVVSFKKPVFNLVNSTTNL